MNEERIDSYVDRSAIADDTKFLTDQLKTVLDLFDKVNSSKISLNGANSMKDVASNANAVNKAIADLQAQNTKLQKSYDDLAKKLAENKKTTDDLQKAKDKLAATQTAEAKEIALVNQQRIENNKQLKIQAELENAAAGSIELARAKVKELTKERNQLNLTTEAGKQRQAELNKELDQYNDFIKENVDELARQKINIGNYPESAKIIVDALEKATQKFKALSQAADTTPAALDDARRHMESLRGVVDNKQFLNYAASAGSAQKEVKAFTRVLIDLEQRGEGNSQAAIDLRKHLAELTDQIADVKQEVKALSSDSRAFDLFAGSVNFAVDTIQAFVGAMSLSADSEQDVQEATKTLIALQTVANGVKGIATELTTRGTAANKLFAFAQNQVAIAMDTTATAGTRLKAALVTIGFGALIIGIGLLIANFDKVKRAITGVSKEQEAYNDVMKDAGSEYANAVKLVSQLKTNIDLAKQGFIEKEKVIKEYNDSLGKTTGQVKSLDQAEKELIEKGDAYIQMTLKKAVANLALEKAAQKAFEAEELRRKKDQEFANIGDKILSADEGFFEAPTPSKSQQDAQRYISEQQAERKKAAIDAKNAEEKVYTDIANEAQIAAAKIAKEFNLNFYGNNSQVQQTAQTKKFRDGTLKDDADMYKKLSENLDAYLTTRISAREQTFDIEKQIIDGQRKIDIENAAAQLQIERQRASIGEISMEELAQKEKEFANKKTDINKDYSEKLELLERNRDRDLLNIRQTFLAHQQDLDKEYNDQFLKDQEALLNAEIAKIQDKQNEQFARDAEDKAGDIKRLNDRYEKRILATREGSRARNRLEEKYAKERADIEYKYADAALKTQIKYAKLIIEVNETAGKDVKDQKKALHELELQLTDLETQHVIDNNKKQAKSHQEKLDAIAEAIGKVKDISEKVGGIIGTIITGNIDQQKNAIQEQIDGIDQKKEKEINAINATTLSEKEKADKIAIIDAQSAAKKEALELKKRKLDEQKARFDKAQAIIGIILNTALAVVKALPNIPEAIAIGAIGAAELAVAIAQPIPKYKGGRKGGKAEWAVTGDGGVQEVVASPDLSQAFVTPATDTLTWVPKNWDVIPDVKTFQETAMSMVHKPLMTMPVITNENEGMIRAMAYEIRGLKAAIMGKQETHFHWNDGELKKAIKKGNDWWRYIQNNI